MNFSNLPKELKLIINVFILTTSVFLTSCSKDNEDIDTFNENEYELQLSHEEEKKLLQIDNVELSEKILEVINIYRKTKNLKPLVSNINAKKCALKHSNYMAENGEMNHYNFKDRSKTLIILENAEKTGENVAFGYNTAKDLVKAWINSPSHKANIEGDFTNSGVGTIIDDNGTLYFTQVFFK